MRATPIASVPVASAVPRPDQVVVVEENGEAEGGDGRVSCLARDAARPQGKKGRSAPLRPAIEAQPSFGQVSQSKRPKDVGLKEHVLDRSFDGQARPHAVYEIGCWFPVAHLGHQDGCLWARCRNEAARSRPSVFPGLLMSVNSAAASLSGCPQRLRPRKRWRTPRPSTRRPQACRRRSCGRWAHPRRGRRSFPWPSPSMDTRANRRLGTAAIVRFCREDLSQGRR